MKQPEQLHTAQRKETNMSKNVSNIIITEMNNSI
jgi:hypothetical protein